MRETAGVPAMMTGSVARGTWVRGDKDIDIFMLFPPTLSREELQEKGLAAAYGVVDKFKGSSEEKYAEHPYLNAVIEGFDVDLVPCYHVESTAEMKCAVDRTPFHTRYLLDRIGGLHDDVLLMKQFAKGGGVYGSDHMTGGFSGYLCELLVLAYGGFNALLQAAAKFRYGEVIDIEEFYPDKKTIRKLFSEPLIVIDPTDKTRNVAAALTPTRFSEFMELARNYCARPRFLLLHSRFPHLDFKGGVRSSAGEKKDSNAGIVIQNTRICPRHRRSSVEKNDGIHQKSADRRRLPRSSGRKWPWEQITALSSSNCWLPTCRRSRFETDPRFGYTTTRTSSWTSIFGKIPLPDLGSVKTGIIPEVERRYTHASELLADKQTILAGSIGKHVRISMEEGYTILKGLEIWSPEFTFFLSAYFAKSSHAGQKTPGT